MIELYHAPISTCSQKVRLVLAHKELDFQSRVLNLMAGDQHESDYRELNPNGVVPTLVDAGDVILESTLINEYLEEKYPEPALLPKVLHERHLVRRWTLYLDTTLHPACSVVTSAVAMRPAQLQMDRDDVVSNLDYIPEPARRAQRHRLFEKGVEAPDFAPAVRLYSEVFDRLEGALSASGGPWLFGGSASLADFGVAPYVLRCEHIGLSWLWQGGRRPAVERWWQQLGQSDAFQRGVAEWLPEAAVAGMRSAGEAADAALRAALD